MTKKTLIITLSSLALVGAGIGTYLLIKRRKIKNLSREEKLKLIHKSLKEDKDFGVTDIYDAIENQLAFRLNKYIKNFRNDVEYNNYYFPYIAFVTDKKNEKNISLVFTRFMGYFIEGFVDVGLNTTITLVFYKDYTAEDRYEPNSNDIIFRKKFSGRNSAVALKKVLEYLCSDKVFKEFEKNNIKLNKPEFVGEEKYISGQNIYDLYNFCQKLK